MEYRELKQAIALNTGLDTETVETVLEEFISIIRSAMERGEKVKIAGFGTFELKKSATADLGDGKIIKLVPRLIFMKSFKNDVERLVITGGKGDV